MGGVDIVDNTVSCYRVKIRAKKWYWPLFTNMLSLAAVNSWRLMNYRNNEKIDLLTHIRSIVANLIRVENDEKITRTSTLAKLQVSSLCSRPMLNTLTLQRTDIGALFVEKQLYIYA